MIEAIGAEDRRPGANWERYQALYQQASQGKASLYRRDPATGLSAPQRVDQEGEKETSSVKNNLLEQSECKTCASRKYADESNDPGVSMKNPTALSPGAAASQVTAHEQEHVSRNADKAEQEGREVLSSKVQIHTDICPECGKTYVSGGTTTTVTGEKKERANGAPNGLGGFFDTKG